MSDWTLNLAIALGAAATGCLWTISRHVERLAKQQGSIVFLLSDLSERMQRANEQLHSIENHTRAAIQHLPERGWDY